jgi:hypothetical protein
MASPFSWPVLVPSALRAPAPVNLGVRLLELPLQNPYRFELVDGRLCKVDPTTGQTIARHDPIGTSIVQALRIDSGIVVREDYYQFPRGQSNVYLLTENFVLVWSAELPWQRDVYANDVFPTMEGLLSCASWDGMSCTIHPETGHILKKVFTK